MKNYYFFLISLLVSCASPNVALSLPTKPLAGMKTPTLLLPDTADNNMKSAQIIFNTYANSDEFYSYVREHVKKLEAGNELNVETAITKYRACLSTHEPISIVLKKYSRKNRGHVYGGWRKTYLAQNIFKDLNPIDRAAHWVHEISHACGFSHLENDLKAHPSIKYSWPYQVGNAFKSFVMEKTTAKTL